ncbi:MAG: type II/IV secretion system protein [Xanthomonadales bacterium]|nr:type II/IV secretion system protein [Xanthomonadales bacterium]
MAAPRFAPEQKLELGQVLNALLDDGLLNKEQANQVRLAQRPGQVDLHPLVMIANLKLDHAGERGKKLTLELLTEWLAAQVQLPYMKLDPMKIDMSRVTDIIGQAYAQRYRILPIEVNEYEVVFATCEPFFETWIPDLHHLLRREIRRVVCNPLDVHRFMMDFYGVTRSVRKAKDAQEQSRENQSKLLNFEQLLELGKAGNVGADDQHVVHIVDWLLQFAFEQRASDIHLEPRRDISPVRFRIDGVMHKTFELPTPVLVAVTSRIKILGRMDLAEKRRPQDGRIKTLSPTGREVEMRLSTMPTAYGEKVVMRIFDPDIVVKDFKALGFSERESQTWQGLINRPHGIVLVTGPTGSGKTTTLYSTLKLLARPELNVCTVEDPIEMVTPDFNQMQVQQQLDLGFAEGVRTLLRQDPDIIMVGEIRDLETAQMAIQASLTGHLVLSTLHTNDSPSAISRLLDLGAPHYLIQSTLAGIMAQRLVRTLCAHCKRKGAAVDEGEWQLLTRPWVAEVPTHACGPEGCLECRRTGFLGRTGIYEMFTISPAIRKLIQADTNLAELTETAVREGMRPLRISAAAQIARGLTTLDEVWKVLPPPEV